MKGFSEVPTVSSSVSSTLASSDFSSHLNQQIPQIQSPCHQHHHSCVVGVAEGPLEVVDDEIEGRAGRLNPVGGQDHREHVLHNDHVLEGERVDKLV